MTPSDVASLKLSLSVQYFSMQRWSSRLGGAAAALRYHAGRKHAADEGSIRACCREVWLQPGRLAVHEAQVGLPDSKGSAALGWVDSEGKGCRPWLVSDVGVAVWRTTRGMGDACPSAAVEKHKGLALLGGEGRELLSANLLSSQLDSDDEMGSSDQNLMNLTKPMLY